MCFDGGQEVGWRNKTQNQVKEEELEGEDGGNTVVFVEGDSN